MSVDQNQGVGPLVGSVVVVLILLAGGYYSLQTIPEVPKTQILDSNSQPVPVISAPAKPPQESTEISDIEADAKEVDVQSIDSGLENLDLLVKE